MFFAKVEMAVRVVRMSCKGGKGFRKKKTVGWEGFSEEKKTVDYNVI